MDSLMAAAAVFLAAVFGGMETVYGYWAWKGIAERFDKVWRSRLFYQSALVWLALLLGAWYSAAAAGGELKEMVPSVESILAVRLAALGLTYILLAMVDVRRRIVPDRVLLCCLAGQLLLAASSQPVGQWGRCFLQGLFLLAVLLAAAWLLRGGLGMGDAKLLGVTAMTAGWSYALWLLAAGLMLSFFAGIWLLVFRKKSAKTEMPFVPFLTAAMAAQLVFLAVG